MLFRSSGVHTNSSPRSIMTPIGPDRLTLPPDHQQPMFALNTQAATTPHRDRPGSSRFAQCVSCTLIGAAPVFSGLSTLMVPLRQYAYNPVEAAQTGVVHGSLSHQQAAPRQALARQVQGNPSTSHAHISTLNRPPYDYLSADAFNEAGPSSGIRPSGKTHMPPPPAPQVPRTSSSLQQRASFRPPATPQRPQLQPSSGSRRFVPPTPTRSTGASGRALLQQASNQQGLHTQRFSDLPNVQAFAGVDSRYSSAVQPQQPGQVVRTPSLAMASSGQRTPFLPNR